MVSLGFWGLYFVDTCTLQNVDIVHDIYVYKLQYMYMYVHKCMPPL